MEDIPVIFWWILCYIILFPTLTKLLEENKRLTRQLIFSPPLNAFILAGRKHLHSTVISSH